ncbi:MAG: DNA cytosine methyltransferase [Methylococcaceae bacterium]|nr:DNA cytosine methyltransferase [Methylococcaceae bacterium]
MNKAVLSVFTGLGLLDEAFRREGFCVVSAGDIVTGQDIRNFVSTKDSFQGVIGGSPCQEFSGLKPASLKTDYSQLMIEEFKRVVLESDVDWYLHENVKGVPDVKIKGYNHQRLIINQGWFEPIQRLRIIQFGCKNGGHIEIETKKILKECDSLALASDKRPFYELKMLQGLSKDFDLPEFTLAGKKKMVGNGVPLSMGVVIASAVKKFVNKNNKNNSLNMNFVTDRTVVFITLKSVLKMVAMKLTALILVASLKQV